MIRNLTKRVCMASVVAIGAGLVAAPAIAEETFICDDGRVLTLRPDQVEELIQTDPCIAKYYGRPLPAAPVPQPATQPAPQQPAPVEQPVAPQAEPAFDTTPAAEQAPPAVPVDVPIPQRKPDDIANKLRALQVDPTAPAAERQPVAVADVPSDFRNVLIINAGKAGSPEFYKHTR